MSEPRAPRSTCAALPLKASWQPLLDQLEQLELDQPDERLAALVRAAPSLAQVDTSHPLYFGAPHGAPSPAAIAGATLAAEHSPDLATRHLAPFAVAAERRLLALIARRLVGDRFTGISTSGASEAVLTALSCALVQAFPEHPRVGLRGLRSEPRVYVSIDAHPSIVKAVRLVGLGDEAIRRVGIDDQQRMSPRELAKAIGEDRGRARPTFVLLTAGSTTCGAIDPLLPLIEIAKRGGCFVHVDAAYGGMLALAPSPPPELAVLSQADSVAFDPHKCLAVPLGLGMLFLAEPSLLKRTFAVPARYLPRTADEPWATSLPWSRGFRALPLLMDLGAKGFAGWAREIDARVALGRTLKQLLTGADFGLVNDTPLPVACFVDQRSSSGASARHLAALATHVRKRCGANVSLVRLASGAPALRATITSPSATAEHVAVLVEALSHARAACVPPT